MSSLPSPNKAKEKLPHADEQRMRWFLAFFFVFCMLTSIIVPSIVFLVTKSILSLSLFSPLLPLIIYLCRRFATFLLPMSQDEKDYQLEMKKIELHMKILESQRRHSEKTQAILIKKHKTISSSSRPTSLPVKQELDACEEAMIEGDPYNE